MALGILLIMGDAPKGGYFLGRALEPGYKDTARSGEEVLYLLKCSHIDLLTHLRLPGLRNL
ncbi:MAG: hypothetical protein ACP5HM_15275 [Anaerolineae bacterium]